MNYEQELAELINIVKREGGSDIHISSGSKPSIRVSGQLTFLSKKNEYTRDDVLSLLAELLIDDRKVETFLQNQEIDFSYSDKQSDSRLRGNAYFQKGGVSISLRLIPKIKDFAELKLPEVLKDFCYKKQGFFLVVGPVGMGKSTTLASMIDFINQKRAEHILTIENPMEYIFENKNSLIDQREIGVDTADFKNALKSAFRQDANVIMIGEMRDAETISAAVTAAETGHLVLSTLHTNNAAQTVDRIIDSFPPDQQNQIRTQLAGSLIGIFSQRLIPKITGGLVPAYELLVNNNAVANLIREKRTFEIPLVIETGLEYGMIDMNKSLVELIRSGDISVENAYAYSTNPKSLERSL